MPYPVGHRLGGLYGKLAKFKEGRVIVKAQRSLRALFNRPDLKKLIASNALKGEIEAVVFSNIRTATVNALAAEAKAMRKLGLKIPAKDLKWMANQHPVNNKFEGLTVRQRLNKWNNLNKKAISRIQALKLTAAKELKEIRQYLSGHNFGQNAFRPTARIIVSEMNRAQQQSGKIMGDYLRGQGHQVAYYWELSSLPNRKRDICDELAEGQHSFGHKFIGMGMWAQKYRPSYPHPFCYCRLHPRIIKLSKQPTGIRIQPLVTITDVTKPIKTFTLRSTQFTTPTEVGSPLLGSKPINTNRGGITFPDDKFKYKDLTVYNLDDELNTSVKQWNKVNEKYFQGRMDGDRLAKMAGVPEQAEYVNVGVVFENASKGYIEIEAAFGKASMQRKLSFQIHENRFIWGKMHNDTLYLKSLSGQGIGADIFANQVRLLSREGITGIDMTASGAGKNYLKAGFPGEAGLNGHYTWVRFGADSWVGKAELKIIKKLATKANFDLKDIKYYSDFMKTSEGRQFWKDWGFNVDLHFSLTPDSQSMKVFDAYLRSKTPAIKVTKQIPALKKVKAPRMTDSDYDVLEILKGNQAIEEYVLHSGDINSSLARGGLVNEESAKLINSVTKTIDDLPAFKKEGTLWKGLTDEMTEAQVRAKFKIGDSWVQDTFSSTSTKSGITKEFMEEAGVLIEDIGDIRNVIFKIKAPAGTKGAYIDRLGKQLLGGSQNEIILQRQSKYTVTAIKKHAGTNYIVEVTVQPPATALSKVTPDFVVAKKPAVPAEVFKGRNNTQIYNTWADDLNGGIKVDADLVNLSPLQQQYKKRLILRIEILARGETDLPIVRYVGSPKIQAQQAEALKKLTTSVETGPVDFHGLQIVKHDTATSYSKALLKAEEATAKAPAEHFTLLDSAGNIKVTKVGQELTVEIPIDAIQKGKNMIATHNHPNDFGLSVDDIKVFTRYRGNLTQLRAKTSHGTYRITSSTTDDLAIGKRNDMFNELEELESAFTAEFQKGEKIVSYFVGYNERMSAKLMTRYNKVLKKHEMKIELEL